MEAAEKIRRTIKSCKHPEHLRVCQNWIENLEKSGKIDRADALGFQIETVNQAVALRKDFSYDHSELLDGLC